MPMTTEDKILLAHERDEAFKDFLDLGSGWHDARLCPISGAMLWDLVKIRKLECNGTKFRVRQKKRQQNRNRARGQKNWLIEKQLKYKI